MSRRWSRTAGFADSTARNPLAQPPVVPKPQTSALIFRPNGGASGSNVYTSFASLCAAIVLLLPGPKTIVFDGNGAGVVIPAGVYVTGPDVTWQGSVGHTGAAGQTQVDAGGCTIDAPATMSNILYSSANLVQPFVWPATSPQRLDLINTSLQGPVGSNYVFHGAAGSSAVVNMWGNSTITNASFSADTLTINMYDSSVMSIASATVQATTLAILVESTSARPDATRYAAGITWVGEPPSEFTYYPGGGIDRANVFSDWTQMIALCRLSPRASKRIYFDLSASADVVVMPAGASDFGGNVALIGLENAANSFFPTINFTLGSSWTTAPVEIRDLSIHSGQAAVYPITFSRPFPTLLLTGGTFIDAAAGSKPVFRIPASVGLDVIAKDIVFLGDGTHAIFETAAAASSTLTMNMCDQADLEAAAITQGAGSIIRLVYDSGAARIPTAYANLTAFQAVCTNIGLDPTHNTKPQFYSGAGSPNGVVTASPPALYFNTTGGANTTLYVKESGASTNTGWVAK
jgi:hypothetical protein